MSTIVIDDHNNFSGLATLRRQNWLVLDAEELCLVLFHQLVLRQVILLIGEIFGLIKAVSVIFEACVRVQHALKQIPGAVPVPTLSHIIEALRTLSFRDAKPEYLRSALTELTDLRRSMGMIFDHNASDMMVRIMAPQQNTVIRTQRLDRKATQFLLAWMLSLCIATGHINPRNYMIYFIIDEMGLLFDKTAQDSRALLTLRHSVLTAREPRVAIIGGAQMVALLAPELLASAGTLICTGLQDNDNIWQTAKAMGVAHVKN